MIAVLAAALAASFNLACSGTSQMSKLEGLTVTPIADKVDFTRIYRIDLDAKRWCAGPCTTTYNLANVEHSRLTLEYQDIDKSASVWTDLVSTVNREDGAYFRRERTILGSGIISTIEEGVCRRAPFTGMPTQQF